MLIIRDGSPSDIPLIQDLAEKTWWPTYSSIISKEQISYMLSTIYSTESLTEVMRDGSQKFILLQSDAGTEGFASFGARKNDPLVYKLHKLYVLPSNHGKGYGRLLIDEIKKRLSVSGVNVLDLNVNRHNPAKKFYEKLGFTIVAEEDVPIGPYWMNDYVMRMKF